VTEDLVLNLGRETLKTAALVSAPLLLSTLVIGLVVSLIQAVTQINEATLTFIPKMLIVGLVILIAGPWMLDQLTTYTTNLFENITVFIRE